VIEFAQFDSEILYNDTAKYKISDVTHEIAHIAPFKLKQLLPGEDGPLKLNLLINRKY